MSDRRTKKNRYKNNYRNINNSSVYAIRGDRCKVYRISIKDRVLRLSRIQRLAVTMVSSTLPLPAYRSHSAVCVDASRSQIVAEYFISILSNAIRI